MIAMQVPTIRLDTLPWLNRADGKSIRLALVGDLMLDEYLIGDAERISPEAPVPVLLVRKSFQAPGGAGNVARNIKLAGGEVQLFSVWGEDETARQLKSLLAIDGIDTSKILSVHDRTTIKKTRVSSGNQQLLRIDWERVEPISETLQQELIRRLEACEFDALLISDYGKGALPIRFLSNLLELAARKKVPSIVDPKGKDFNRYLHASMITPNRKEACEALGLDPSGKWTGEELGRRLQETFGLRSVLVTLGAEGMILTPERKSGQAVNAVYFPARAREVYDVSGAGDTVVAIMALCIASGASYEEGMYLSTLAAGRVVEKWGTQPITQSELETLLSESQRVGARSVSSASKILSRTAAIHEVQALKRRGRKVVFTNGCFDLLHAGHVSYLEEAKSRGDVLVVGLNSDASVKRIKGANRPVNSLEHRARVLASLGAVDFVVPFEEDTPLELITSLVPNVLVKGADWKATDIVGADVVKAAGGVVDTITLVPGVSTTGLIEKMR